MTNPLPEEANPPLHYRIVIDRMGRQWLSANDRIHWAVRKRLTEQWRTVGARQSHVQNIPKLTGGRVICELRLFTRRNARRRDASNWAPTAKALVDGLVDGQVFPDDDSTRVIGPDLRMGPAVGDRNNEQLIIHIWPTGGGPA